MKFLLFVESIALVMLVNMVTAAPVPPPATEQIPNFKLPAGFEIQLVVADPNIGQPMNLNFDARGRLWITHSIEYPYPAKGPGVEPRPSKFPGIGDHAPRDRLTVASGIDPDGKPAKIQHFATGLNIPIGHTPIGDGSRAVVYGIPSIFRFDDLDGDGKAEAKKTLYTSFGNIDVHGDASSFTRWIDGWIYGCHGFSNTSNVRDGSGNVTTLRSGNTYRFREDGSHFEQFTWGQVNPFGITFDPLGNHYTSDCHSMPIYMMLRGAYYPSFGKPHDGLGFAPKMINHSHGSTGVCGPAYYAADHFPPEYRHNLFICNPVTGRVHRDKLTRFGSTYQCATQDDFISTTDKWFRPVDAIVGPDGALYIADFCNLIIGHYEAPLDHPDRDRTHGRVWRIVWRGKENTVPVPENMPDLTKLTTVQLAGKLADANLQIRTLATNYLVDAHRTSAPAAVRDLLTVSESSVAHAHSLWVLERLENLDDSTARKIANQKHSLPRVHLMRILSERTKWNETCSRLALAGLTDDNAFVNRTAVDAIGRHPHESFVLPLLDAWKAALPQDTHLIHVIRIAIREHLQERAIVTELLTTKLDADQQRRLLEIAAATKSEVVAPLLMHYADPETVSTDVMMQAAGQLARFGTAEQLSKLIQRIQARYVDDPSTELQLLLAIVSKLEERGVKPADNQQLSSWLKRLAPKLLAGPATNLPAWTHHQVSSTPPSPNPWGVRHRNSTDGDQNAIFWDSIVGGEASTGVLRSRAFRIPATLSFWMCGHNGHPNTNHPPVNHVRLVLAASGKEIAKEIPPRHDTARQYTWKLAEFAGQQGRIEIVDAHRENSYAWLGVGRFNPPLVRVPSGVSPAPISEMISLLGKFKIDGQAPKLRQLAADQKQETELRLAAIECLGQFRVLDETLEMMMKMVADNSEQRLVRGRAARVVGGVNAMNVRAGLNKLLVESPGPLQLEAAVGLAQTEPGLHLLVDTISSGKASAQLLVAAEIAELIRLRGGEALVHKAKKLTAKLPSISKEVAVRIAELSSAFSQVTTDPTRGSQLFTKHCAACHRIGNEGGLVGPQLDGIGNRGLERILEDLLDPNRNVDNAFRTTTFVKTDGQVIAGLARPKQGNVIVIVDALGKEIRIPGDEVEDSQRSNLSLMPTTLANSLPKQDLHDLVAWLLSNRQVK